MSTETDLASVTTEQYVRYFFAGVIVAEESDRPIASREPVTAGKLAPEGAFAFEFYDKVTATVYVDGENLPMSSKHRNTSGRFYIDGERLTEEDVERLGGGYRVLLENMRSNRWPAVVRTRAGSYQPLYERDGIVSSS